MFNAAKREIDNYEYLFENINNANLQNRMRISFNYYVEMAVAYKVIWNIVTFLSIALPALATFLSVLADISGIKYAITGITALTTLSTGILGSYKVNEKKQAYRKSAEEIKSLASEYLENVRVTKDNERISDLQTKLLKDVNAVIKEEKKVISSLEDKGK